MSEYQRLSQLMAEADAIMRALDNLNAGGFIAQMIISPPNEPPPSDATYVPRSPAQISTIGWSYPPQMTDTIKTLLNARYAEISKELADLGFTQPVGETAS